MIVIKEGLATGIANQYIQARIKLHLKITKSFKILYFYLPNCHFITPCLLPALYSPFHLVFLDHMIN